MTTLVDLLMASDLADRMSLTNVSAASSTARLTRNVRIPGAANEANTATTKTVIISSTRVKPV